MKKTLSLFGLLLAAGLSYAQSGLSSGENYIYTSTCLNEDCSRKTEAVQYSDGLGRVKQTIGIKSSPAGKDIVTPVEYDGFGRQVRSYLPIPQPGTQGGAFYANPKAAAPQAYGSDPYFYSESVPEQSPAGKLLATVKPGADYQGHPVSFGYGVNAVDEVKKYTVTTSWVNGVTDNSVAPAGNYGAGQLMKTSVTDEDGHAITDFKNGKGQTVLVKKENSVTYYLYNKYGQLVYVIPPLAAEKPLSQAVLDDLCYQYRYDAKGRQAEKKLPGKGWEYTVYDRLDRALMTQDASLGALKQWLFTKYDRYGRVTFTGTYTGSQAYTSAGRAAEQAQADASAVQDETRHTAGFNANGITAYYTNAAYPVSFTKILSVNYYDTYPQGSPARPPQVLGKATVGDDPAQPLNTKTLPTASFVKNLEDDSWTRSFIWYDEKARAVATHSVNYLSGYTRTESLLDFAGVPQQTKVYHKRLATDIEKIITQNFEYDRHNRLKKQWHQVDAQPQELLSENTYNELSQLSNKKTGGSLQSIDYTYNMRGALVRLNDPGNPGTGLFAYELKYYAPSATATGKRTGNVEEASWKTATDQVLRKYTYRYDALNRMTSGIYSEPGISVPQNNFYNEAVTYDAGGNILTLQRNGKNVLNALAQIDNLSYTYNGNRLASVTDDSQDYAGYPDVSGNTISYDDNGNMTSHADKGILEIKYNILDLPDYVKFDRTYVPRYDFGQGSFNVNTRYLYRADGTRLKNIYTYGSGRTNQETSTETDYLDGFQYEASNTGNRFTTVLKFVPTAEGYYDFEKNKYIYSYTDHLGNIRLSYFRNANNSAEVLDENNFYPFGLKHEGYNQTAGNPSYNYEYNGKELQRETGWSDFGARMYMADIGRWGVVDPLAESTTRVSPYNYALNNPVMFVDPDGRKAYNPEPVTSDIPRGGLLDFFGSGGYTQWGSYEEFIGKDVYGYSKKGSEGVYGGGSATTFGETQAYKDIMAYLAEPASSEPDFSKFDFSKYGDFKDEEPVNFFGKSDKSVFHKKFKEMHDLFKNTKGDGVFRVYGHGNLQMIWDGDTQIFNAADFDKAMMAKNKNWANVDNYKRPILILFSCLSATDVGKNGSIAKQISKAHPKLVVIGFRGFVEYDLGVEAIQNVSRQQGKSDGNGLIIFYRNGKALNGYNYQDFLKVHKNFK